MAKEFFRGDEAKHMNHSICLYQGVPYYITCYRDTHEVMLHKLGPGFGNVAKVVDYRDPEFDTKAPALGYMNYDGQAHYLVRTPRRLNKQCLDQQAISTVPEGSLRHADGWFTSEEFEKCILGQHPDLAAAFDNLNNGWESVAFHRRCALVKLSSHAIGLNYAGRLVGLYENNKLRLLQSSHSTFLEKILQTTGAFKEPVHASA